MIARNFFNRIIRRYVYNCQAELRSLMVLSSVRYSRPARSLDHWMRRRYEFAAALESIAADGVAAAGTAEDVDFLYTQRCVLLFFFIYAT